MGYGAISDLVVKASLFEECCLSLGEKHRPHRDSEEENSRQEEHHAKARR